MRFNVSDEDIHKAKWPHDLFLINLIFNHILMFAAFLTASSLWEWVILVPSASLMILLYTLWRANKSLSIDSWYVKCHWQICYKRSKIFIGMIVLMLVAIGTVLLISGGEPKPQHIALSGAAVLPTMVMVLVLIILETESLDDARKGRVPDSVAKRFPEGQYAPLEG
jgi:membrane-associated HD superfamily phosphohydrolase